MKSHRRMGSLPRAAIAVKTLNAGDLGAALYAQACFERAVAFGFVNPNKANETAVRRDVTSVDDFATTVLLMVGNFCPFSSRLTSMVETERLLASLGIGSSGRHGVSATGTSALQRRVTRSASCEQHSGLAATERVGAQSATEMFLALRRLLPIRQVGRRFAPLFVK
eukprot:3891152-Pleurochrysis_carterae.AAC.1